mmetsp:Transcript_60161/g.176535  ORF Transcript_60161/g.176535 Transcript_60161/m.176535 type:complete len:203 (+) Transcript_60161:182-790(+)
MRATLRGCASAEAGDAATRASSPISLSAAALGLAGVLAQLVCTSVSLLIEPVLPVCFSLPTSAAGTSLPQPRTFPSCQAATFSAVSISRSSLPGGKSSYTGGSTCATQFRMAPRPLPVAAMAPSDRSPALTTAGSCLCWSTPLTICLISISTPRTALSHTFSVAASSWGAVVRAGGPSWRAGGSAATAASRDRSCSRSALPA